MPSFIASRGHPDRIAAEALIRTVYRLHYGAEIASFPTLLAVSTDDRGRVVCASGLRTPAEGFFSEVYLASPVEEAIGSSTIRSVERHTIFEVTTLASRSPVATMAFIRDIVGFGAEAGFVWSFFTVTQRLHAAVERLGLQPIMLADAERSRLADAASWGSYYDHRPRVCAVERPLRMVHSDPGTGMRCADAAAV
jgi:hypothetical protein